jgi:hypothetical protein
MTGRDGQRSARAPHGAALRTRRPEGERKDRLVPNASPLACRLGDSPQGRVRRPPASSMIASATAAGRTSISKWPPRGWRHRPPPVPRATGRRRAVGTELEIATRRVRPAGNRGQRPRPELARLWADLRHDSGAKSLVGDLLQQVFVALSGEAAARGEQGLELVGQRWRCRSQQVDPAAPAARRKRQVSIDKDVCRDGAVDGRPDGREQRAGPAVAGEHQRAAGAPNLGRDRLCVQTPVTAYRALPAAQEPWPGGAGGAARRLLATR